MSAEEERKNGSEVLSVLGDKYSADILAAADTPRSARELSERGEVPIATCYRRIDDLVDAGLLEPDGRGLAGEGRRTTLYRRTVDSLTIEFSETSVTVDQEE